MRRRPRLLALGLLLASASCFHQVVQTGRPASGTVVDLPWVAIWLWGLVPAEDIDVRSRCPNGVAVVETQQSFANSFVGIITLGIYTPQRVRVTCASAGTSLRRIGAEIVVAPNATPAEQSEAIGAAITASHRTNLPVVIRF